MLLVHEFDSPEERSGPKMRHTQCMFNSAREMSMDESELIEIVKTRIGAATDADAERAIEAVLTTLGERMPAVDVQVVAAELPPRFARAMQLRSHDPGMSLEEFYARVSRRAGLSHGFAREHVQAVCRALYALLDPRAQPCIDVWPELVRPSLADRWPPVVPTHGRTLATGRPGSRHPLSEAKPAKG
jgi:uncharacterized protein (DUF2267 family)